MVRECAHWNKINPVIQVLQEEGFNLLGLATYLLTFHQAEEFLEVYRFHTAQFGGSNTNTVKQRSIEVIFSPEELLTNGVKV